MHLICMFPYFNSGHVIYRSKIIQDEIWSCWWENKNVAGSKGLIAKQKQILEKETKQCSMICFCNPKQKKYIFNYSYTVAVMSGV